MTSYDETKMLVDHAMQNTGVGHTSRLACPACGERTMTATRIEPNVVAYTCHRATCHTQGYIGRAGMAEPFPVKKEQVVYTGTTQALTIEDWEYFLGRFRLGRTRLSQQVYRNAEAQYVFPVRGPKGVIRGYVVRRGAWSDNDSGSICPLPKVLPKSKSYRNDPHGAFCAWYRPMARNSATGPVILVEDTVSALCVSQQGIDAVALLGTHMSNEIARELQIESRQVILALDSDATDTALKIAAKWGPALPNLRVAILTNDLKDDITQLNNL